MLGLGNSVGTPAEGVEGEVLVVRSFRGARRRRRTRAREDRPLQRAVHQLRRDGAVPRRRAVARGVRSARWRCWFAPLGPPGLRTPHTGALRYADGQPQIPGRGDHRRRRRPAAAHAGSRHARYACRLKMEAQFLPDADSANVVGEIRGRERPDEVVVDRRPLRLVGRRHRIDRRRRRVHRDVGSAAADEEAEPAAAPDGAGRAVDQRGERRRAAGSAYRDRYRDQLANHVLMMESDGGVFRPTGFGFTGSDAGAGHASREIATLLAGIQADRIGAAGDGADIGPASRPASIPAMSLEVEGNYFLIHHTPADTIDKIDPMDMARASAAIAVMTYVIADMPERLSS